MLNDLLSTYYRLEARREASKREGLDLHFDCLYGNKDSLARLKQMLQAQGITESVRSMLPISGIEFYEQPAVPDGQLWLFERRQPVGIWDLDKGEIVQWIAGHHLTAKPDDPSLP